MNLEEGINLYVRRKHSAGVSFVRSSETLRAFLRRTGNLPLDQIDANLVQIFLDCGASVASFRRNHSLLRCFFEYWAARGEMAPLSMPTNHPAKRSTFLPYIFSREELRRILRSAPLYRTTSDQMHSKTLRCALLTLYSTGAILSEITKLRTEDVNLQEAFITFPGTPFKAARRIPIGKDLVRELVRYAKWRNRNGKQSKAFFSRGNGKEISQQALSRRFRSLRRRAGIAGYRESAQEPCLRDLRATFAVHRISSWLKKRQDMNLMLPALGVYIGNIGLESAERYLQLTPQRFQSALNKLSPQKGRARWRRDSVLLEFLRSF